MKLAMPVSIGVAGENPILTLCRGDTSRCHSWRGAQFDTLRLRLIKVAARVVDMKTMIRVHLPTSCTAQDILRLVLGRIPRLVT